MNKRMLFVAICFFLSPLVNGLSLNKVNSAAINGEIEESRHVNVEIEGQKVNTTLIGGNHASRITVSVTFRNEVFIVDLTLNTYLLSSSYVERIITRDGAVYRQVNQSQESCYYNGNIRNEVHSSAAFSTCNGVKGFFVLNNSTFHIKPVQLDSNSSLVGLYEIKKANNDHLSQWICGADELKKQYNEVSVKLRVKRQIITESLDGKKVIELYVVNDNRRLRFFNGDYNALSRSTREIVNAANLLYQPVGFFIVLVGVEHWQTDQIEVVTDSSKTLSNWHSYRTKYILNNHYNDVGFLISGQAFDSSVLGLASIGSMCSSRGSGGIMSAILDKSAVSGAILAHEIGHNLGLEHDSADCRCDTPGVSCIMSSRASTDRPSVEFSACSKAKLQESVNKGIDICLKDFPLNLNEHSSVCGNGILEQGEDCDCGRMPSDQCNPSCCNPSTCKLIGSAQCASGSCCEVNSCKLKQVNTQCRASIGPCDLPETCDGRSAFCPKNVYKHDGLSCSLNGVDAYCWKGMCRTHRSQCQELYGYSVSESNSICYQVYNPMGSVYGWCSLAITDQINYGGCQQEDVMCGALQCDTNAASLVRFPNYVMQTNKYALGFQCKGSLLDYGSRVENPGMVPNGASCGSGKMCVSQKCVPASSVLGRDPCPNCQHGICTNEGKCQCYAGYAGPNCNRPENVEDPLGAFLQSTTTTTTTSTTTTVPTTTTTTTTTTKPTTTTTTTTTTKPTTTTTKGTTTTTMPTTTTIPTSTTTTTMMRPTTTTTTTSRPWMPNNPVDGKTTSTLFKEITYLRQTPTRFLNYGTTPSYGINIPAGPTPFLPFNPPVSTQRPNAYPVTMARDTRITPTKFNMPPNVYRWFP